MIISPPDSYLAWIGPASKVRFLFSFILSVFITLASAQDFKQILDDAQLIKDQDPAESEKLVISILEADSMKVPVSVRLQSLQLLGLIKMYNYQFEESSALFDRAFSLVRWLQPDDQDLVGSLYLDMGRNFNWQSTYDSALNAFLRAKEIYEKTGNKNGIAQSLNSIAVIAIQYSNDPAKALAYFQSALQLHMETGDQESSARVMQNIGQIYNMTGRNDSALHFIRKSNDMVEALKDYRSLAIGSNILGAIFHDLSEYDSSEYYYKKAIALDLQNQDSVGLIYDYSQLAATLLAKQDFSEAIKYGQLAFENTKDIYLKSESAEVLSRINEEQQRYSTALAYYKQFKTYSDSIRREDQQATIDELQTKYETSEKEKEIQLANIEIERKQRFQTFLFIVIAVITLFSLITIFLMIQRFKLKKRLLFQEIDTLRANINSLFSSETRELTISLEEINNSLHKPLSEREYEILNHAISEKTNGEIAEAVYVSVNTVKTHLKNIYTKLGVSNRKEAIELLLTR